MERHEIETFLALAEELHFGRAAARVGRTTARVSQTLRVIERRVGTALFDRTSRRVSLTGTGQRLYDDLRPAYEQLTAAVNRAVADGRGLTGRLRVGFVGAAAGQLAMRAAGPFRRDHAGCELSVREVHLGGAAERLRADEIDLLFGCFPLEGPGVTVGAPLLSEPRRLAVPARHPFAARASLSVEDIAGSRLLVAPCAIPAHDGEDAARRTPSGRAIPDGPAAETFQEVLTLVGAGQGTFVVGEHVTRFFARPDVVYVPLHDAPPLHWGPAWRTGGPAGRVHAFVAAADAGRKQQRHGDAKPMAI